MKKRFPIQLSWAVCYATGREHQACEIDFAIVFCVRNRDV